MPKDRHATQQRRKHVGHLCFNSGAFYYFIFSVSVLLHVVVVVVVVDATAFYAPTYPNSQIIIENALLLTFSTKLNEFLHLTGTGNKVSFA